MEWRKKTKKKTRFCDFADEESVSMLFVFACVLLLLLVFFFFAVVTLKRRG